MGQVAVVRFLQATARGEQSNRQGGMGTVMCDDDGHTYILTDVR